MFIKLTANKTYINGEETICRGGRGASVKDREGLALALKALIMIGQRELALTHPVMRKENNNA